MRSARKTSIGIIAIEDDGEAIVRVFLNTRESPTKKASSPLVEKAFRQLDEYLAGKRTEFDLPLRPAGTPFMESVWKALQNIPYGTTASYKDIAEAIGRPKACRAVGLANNRNPIAIFIPCHRVIGKNGSLTGYAGGLPMKEKLLKLEGVFFA